MKSALQIVCVAAIVAVVPAASAADIEWTRQLGTSGADIGRSVSVDSSGNAYVTGYTDGGLDGNTSAGGNDMFLVKYEVPEPATMSVLALGGLAVLKRRRRMS